MKKLILKWAVRHLLKAVTMDDLLRNEDGKVFIGKRVLDAEEIRTLKSQAKVFEKSLIWELMIGNLYWIANFKMMKAADKEIEMVNGRMMTLCIDTIEDFMTKLKELK